MQSQIRSVKINPMKKKLTNRDKQAQATKKKIYQVGIKLIQKHGLDGVNVTQIAKSAGVSVGTFYHYYNSKLDLFMDLYRKADQYYETELVHSLKGCSYPKNVYRFFDEYAELAVENGVPLTQKMYVPENTLFTARTQGMHAVLEALICDAQVCGLCKLKDTPQEIEKELFLIARGVIFDWALYEGSYDLKEKMQKMLALYLESA